MTSTHRNIASISKNLVSAVVATPTVFINEASVGVSIVVRPQDFNIEPESNETEAGTLLVGEERLVAVQEPGFDLATRGSWTTARVSTVCRSRSESG